MFMNFANYSDVYISLGSAKRELKTVFTVFFFTGFHGIFQHYVRVFSSGYSSRQITSPLFDVIS